MPAPTPESLLIQSPVFTLSTLPTRLDWRWRAAHNTSIALHTHVLLKILSSTKILSPAGLLLVHGLARQPRQRGKLEDHGARAGGAGHLEAVQTAEAAAEVHPRIWKACNII